MEREIGHVSNSLPSESDTGGNIKMALDEAALPTYTLEDVSPALTRFASLLVICCWRTASHDEAPVVVQTGSAYTDQAPGSCTLRLEVFIRLQAVRNAVNGTTSERRQHVPP